MSDHGRGALFDALVREERERQDAKWGADCDDSPPQAVTVLTEEVGEVARAVLEKDPANLAEELVQVAAVCRKYFEKLPDWRAAGGPLSGQETEQP